MIQIHETEISNKHVTVFRHTCDDTFTEFVYGKKPIGAIIIFDGEVRAGCDSANLDYTQAAWDKIKANFTEYMDWKDVYRILCNNED